jgi:membrane protein DedA with SNARE-associated domain
MAGWGADVLRFGTAVIDALSTTLSHLFQHEFSWLAQFFSLVVLPFAHEDLAIILGAYIVVNKIMPAALVVLCIYGGMVASDFVLYGIGAGARRLPWLTRIAVNDRVRGFGDTLKRNLFGLVALCRVVPGIVFVAFIACGWTRVSLARFTVASLVVSALYLPLMLCIVVFFGDALDDRAGLWTWPFLLCVLAAIGFLRRQVFTFQGLSDASESQRGAGMLTASPRRTATGDAGKVTLAERLPLGLIYLPLLLRWLGFAARHRSLTLPMAANPGEHAGQGAWEERKSDYLLSAAAIAPESIAGFVVVRRSAAPRMLYADLEQARQLLSDAGLSFPLVAKPDIGRAAVRRIDDVADLREYLRGFPSGESLILQRFVPDAGRATVLYARLPGARSGRILSLTLRDHRPTADGTTVRYRDGRRCITPELEAHIDAIARGMPEFHYGRFELRFASPDGLMRGDGVSIVEISGVGGVANDTWDPSLSLTEAYRRAVEQQRIMFLIGDKNRARGFAPVGSADVVKSLVRRSQLSRRYPASA